MELSKHFKLSEFASPDGVEPSEFILCNLKRLCGQLEVIRAGLNSRIRINSGYRSENWNDIVLPQKGYKTAKNSFHKKGMAADLVPLDLDLASAFEHIMKLIDTGRIMPGGLKLYSSFIHYDIRGYYATW